MLFLNTWVTQVYANQVIDPHMFHNPIITVEPVWYKRRVSQHYQCTAECFEPFNIYINFNTSLALWLVSWVINHFICHVKLLIRNAIKLASPKCKQQSLFRPTDTVTCLVNNYCKNSKKKKSCNNFQIILKSGGCEIYEFLCKDNIYIDPF